MSEIGKNVGYGQWNVGRKASEDTLRKMSEAQRGHSRNVGRSLSEDHRKKLSDALKGEKSHLWKGGVTPEGTKIRSSMEYRDWRRDVFKRDDFTCVACGERGVRLHADHIKPFALYPELRFDIANGRTLCVPCHKQTPTYLKSRGQLVEACYPGIEIIEV